MPKCPYYLSVSIKRELRYKVKETCFINEKTKADIFGATKSLNYTLALISANYGNPMVNCHNLGEICTSNQAEIFTALNHCLVLL